MASKLVSDILQSGKTEPVYQWRRGGVTKGDTNYYLTVGDVDSCKTQAEFLKHVVMIFKSTRDVEITGKFDISGASFGSGAIDGDSIADGSITSEKFASYVVLNGELNGTATRAMFDGDPATNTSKTAQAIHNKYATKSWVQGAYTTSTDLASNYLLKTDASSTYAAKTDLTTLQTQVTNIQNTIGKGTVTPGGNTTFSGTNTVTGKLIMDARSADSNPAIGDVTNINLQFRGETANGTARTFNPFFVYPAATTGHLGFGIQGAFGGLVIGSGESAKNVVEALKPDGGAEHLYLLSDKNIYLGATLDSNVRTESEYITITNRNVTNLNSVSTASLTASGAVSVGGALYGVSGSAQTWKITNAGAVTGISALTCSGLVQAQQFNSTSDLRLKSDLEPIQHALEKVQTLCGFTYTLNNKRQAGLIAQDVRRVLPEAVTENDDGYLSLDYNAVVAMLVNAVQILAHEVETLKKELPETK